MRKDGVVKPVLLCCFSFGILSAGFLNVTRRSIFVFSFSLSFSFSSSFCLSFPFPFKVTKSSLGADFLDLVAVRMLCSSEDLNLWNPFALEDS